MGKSKAERIETLEHLAATFTEGDIRRHVLQELADELRGELGAQQ